MRAFYKWFVKSTIRDIRKMYCRDSWQAALKWYQLIADKCEQDCNTDEDYKTLYFHLKQVLINEIKE